MQLFRRRGCADHLPEWQLHRMSYSSACHLEEACLICVESCRKLCVYAQAGTAASKDLPAHFGQNSVEAQSAPMPPPRLARHGMPQLAGRCNARQADEQKQIKKDRSFTISGAPPYACLRDVLDSARPPHLLFLSASLSSGTW